MAALSVFAIKGKGSRPANKVVLSLFAELY